MTGLIKAFFQRCRSAIDRHRRRGERACLRCGRPARVVCSACGAKVCDRCWRLSLETGSAAFLCIECLASCPPSRPTRQLGGSEVFGAGVKLLLVAILVVASAGYWRGGWPGAWSVLGTLLHPTILLGLVPLAFLLGAIQSALLHALRALLRGFSRPSA